MDPSPPGRASNAGLVVVGMLLAAFVLIAAGSITAVSLTGSSGSASTDASAVPEARRAADAIQARLAHDGWRQSSVTPIALGATEECAPLGWNAGATSRAQSVLDHRSGTRPDGEAVVDLSVYRSAKDAGADLDRARAASWVDCHRREMQRESDAGTTAVFRRLAGDPGSTAITYSYRYLEDHELEAGTVHIVVVGQVRATVTCECPHLGPAARRGLAQQVAAGLR